MNAAEVLADLNARGVILEAKGARLRVDAPHGVLATADRLALIEYREGLLVLLSASRAEPGGELGADAAPSVSQPTRYDPRPDLATDGPLWSELLRLAEAYDGDSQDGVYQALHGFRCLGAALVRDGDTARLLPGEINDAEYAELRARWLVPHREVLVALLQRVGTGDGLDTLSVDAERDQPLSEPSSGRADSNPLPVDCHHAAQERT